MFFHIVRHGERDIGTRYSWGGDLKSRPIPSCTFKGGCGEATSVNKFVAQSYAYLLRRKSQCFTGALQSPCFKAAVMQSRPVKMTLFIP